MKSLYPGVHPLYAVGAFVCAIIMLILIIRININKKYGNAIANFSLFMWVLFFCLQDGIWGILASHTVKNDTALFVSSAIFHMCSAITPFIWVRFHIASLGKRVKHIGTIKTASVLLIAVQYVMIIVNFSTKYMFYVDDAGEYCSTPYRKILFYLQFAVYIIIGIVSMVQLVSIRNTAVKQNLSATFCMNISPVFFGIFQMLYPDAPANSIGFAIACIIFYTFIEADYERQITEYRAKATYQEIIEKQNTELLEQKALLQDALKAEEEASKAKTSFLFNMSHDIRTPMNAIIGFTTMAKKRIDDVEKTEDYLNKIEVAGKQLLSLINQVLEMSRIESGKIVLNDQKTDIVEFASIIKTIYEEVAASKGIELSVNVTDVEHCNVITDVDRMKQIVTNIIGNAIKYTKDGGTVSFSISETDSNDKEKGKYIFVVEDTGIGMSEEFVEHIFDEFSREETSTVNKIQGTGLGMSIVKRLTDIMGGNISIESQKGVGTKITVVMPMVIDNNIKEIETTKVGKISIEGLRVLLVEDNEMNREIASEILSDEGVIVEIASDGTEAVEKIRKMYDSAENPENAEKFDCILMDIQMPIMNGFEATAKIRSMETDNRHIPIIALSANAFEEDRKKSIENGMDDHISKPIVINELISTLAKLLSSYRKNDN